MSAFYTADQAAKAKRKLDRIFARPNGEDSSEQEDDCDESSDGEYGQDDHDEEECERETGLGKMLGQTECKDEGGDNDDDDDDDYRDDGEEDDNESTDEEDEEDKAGASVHVYPDTYLSKDRKIEWSSVPLRELDRDEVPEYPIGPTAEAIAGAQDILSSFLLFFTADLESLVLRETNREGSSRHVETRWKQMDETELRAYVGLLILAGVYRSRGEAASSLWDGEYGRTIFRATMSLKEFYRFSETLRFDDRKSRGVDGRSADRLAAIRELWDMWSQRLPVLYHPGQYITVDERMVPFKGRCSFRQYMPNKPAKYGLKLWVACDAETSYAWRMQAYTGKPDASDNSGTGQRTADKKVAGEKREMNLGSRVVLDLTRGLEHRLVTCDNFFTSYELARKLRSNNIALLGTIRSNRTELPQELLSARGREVLSSRFAHTELATLISYVPKRNKTVLLLSTRHTQQEINSECKGRKPQAILDYNHTKGGVDTLDKLLATYSCRRMTKRWPVAMFHNIIDVSAYNAFVIWRETHPEWMPRNRSHRRIFLAQLGKDLVMPLIIRRGHTPRTESSRALVTAIRGIRPKSPPSSRKRRRCQVCPRVEDVKTNTACQGCEKYICSKCTLSFCAKCAGVEGE